MPISATAPDAPPPVITQAIADTRVEPLSSQTAEQVSTETAAPAGENASPEVSANPTDKEARQLFLQAQKAERRANEQLKRAKSSAAKAEALEAALSQLDKDPTAILKAAGLDPRKYYQQLTTYALNDGAKRDPVQEELAQLRAKQAEYAAALEEQKTTQRQREEHMAEANVVAQQVAPIIQNNPDAFETIVGYCGDDTANAAIYVYNTVKDIYMQTGETRSFQEVAQELEKYHEEQTELGIKRALSMKKFSKYGVAPTSEKHDRPQVQYDNTLPRAKTLTNNLSAAPVNPVGKPPPSYSDNREDRIRQVLKKHGL